MIYIASYFSIVIPAAFSPRESGEGIQKKCSWNFWMPAPDQVEGRLCAGMTEETIVIPAQAGIQKKMSVEFLDSCFRRNDEENVL